MAPAELNNAIADPRTYANPGTYHELFRTLRVENPVRWTEPSNYRPFWTISKHADILEIEKQSELFANAPRTLLRTHEQEEQVRKLTGSVQAVRTLVHMDEPDHRMYRQLTQAWFMPGRLRVLEESLAKLASEFVDRMARLGGDCDFARDIAAWYPLRVIMMILGVPPEDEALMLRLTQEHFGGADPDVNKDKKDATSAVRGFFEYFKNLTNERRKAPKDDLASLLANAEIGGKPISDFDRNSYYFLVATAGHDTTSSSISGLLQALLEYPDQLAKLRGDPSLVPSAVDEGIRWVTPVRHFFRTATRDCTFRGQDIKNGDSLMLCYWSGNRDEEVFTDPYAFRIDRSPNRHLAFGYGIHLCLGQMLAKMEIRALYKELISRVKTIELNGKPDWLVTNFVGGLKTLPISYRLN
ncbi:cytochrome P450 [Bradyrhizobium sp. AUGA SZCCT0240]|uniref:cytochrome P450 n=1 Tax=Bradyrhizobium sp. AUGA SZCCT0240 TaxID=2807669 RepID=UPI001BACAA68|nr:cytochrome P450 [Bradyrhizobium sp. AUGA SZCCT0240]MBR1256366.1 cytochrome P450 [Bradyrhizobium sp. AUGA SZCCT0240]